MGRNRFIQVNQVHPRVPIRVGTQSLQVFKKKDTTVDWCLRNICSLVTIYCISAKPLLMRRAVAHKETSSLPYKVLGFFLLTRPAGRPWTSVRIFCACPMDSKAEGRQNPVPRKLLAFLLLQVLFATALFSYVRQSSGSGSPTSPSCPETPLQETAILRPPAPQLSSNLTILLWTWPYGIHVPFENCFEVLGVPDCHFTVDRHWYPKADALLVHHYDVYLDAKKLPQEPRPPFQRWVWYSPEPPSKHPVPDFMDNLFNFSMSYRRDSDIYAPYGWLEVLPQPQKVTVPPKSKLVAWVVSNWKPKYVQVRVKYYEELKKYIQVDLYGRGHSPLSGSQLLSTLSQYKFYLAFENSQHEDYISEKVWRNAFLSGAVPVVLGPSRKNYESHIPPDSFIHVDDFSSPRELAGFLQELDKNATRYESYFQWRSRLRSVNYKSWGYQFCKACQALQQKPAIYQTLPELSKWFK
ncbi:3-galactosyl-N-acetylglucosaminide 4-alpha-L-fucosyltransferase FUT3 [Pogona vitticeps]